MGFVLLLVVSYSVVIYRLVQSTAFNVILAAVFHLMINITNLFSYRIIKETSFIVVNALVWAAIAVAVVMTRKTLFISNGPRLDGSERNESDAENHALLARGWRSLAL